MGNYLTEFLSFVAGGGLLTLINLRTSKKTANLEYMEKLKLFWEGENIKLMERVTNCESQIKVLFFLKCERNNCKLRIPPSETDFTEPDK